MCKSYCYDKNFFVNFFDWKKEYVEYLKTAYGKGEDKYKGLNYYQDPDSKESYNRVYYRNLAEFLNQRESALSNIINDEKFIYEADNYPGRGVLILVKSKDEKELFFLQSDQLGFSAPNGYYAFKKQKKRIYDVYLEGSKDEDKEEKVAEWIGDSRTIGGSFLWPLEKGENRNPDYNKARGNYYIQDRCDLTLAEIRGCYEKDMRTIGEERNYLYNKMQNDENENKNLIRWLRHFGDFETGGFETYVKYFCMEEFVETDRENNKKYCPINLYKKTNIFNGNYVREDIYDKTKNEKEYYNDICNMLNELCKRIVVRSVTMEKIILNSQYIL